MTQCNYTLMPQSEVTKRPEVTARAVALLKSWREGKFPVGSTDSQELTHDGIPVDYRYEWHPPDFQNESRHTGITVFWCPGGQQQPPLVPPAPPSVSPPPPSVSSPGDSSSPTSSPDPEEVVCVAGGADDVEGAGDAS